MSTELNDLELAQQGAVQGIIEPPTQIRAICDKTARFVAKNGKSFEEKIINSEEGSSAKFSFLRPFDPFHGYYEYRIAQFEECIREGKVCEVEKLTLSFKMFSLFPKQSMDDVVSQPPAPTVKASDGKGNGDQSKVGEEEMKEEVSISKTILSNPFAKYTSQQELSHPPPPIQFTLTYPPKIGSDEVEVIKLTSQYTALNGRKFLSYLAEKEATNSLFDFLKPTHLHFGFFTTLVDMYTRILKPPPPLHDELKVHEDREKTIDGIAYRWEWNRREMVEKREREEEEKEVAQIDWHDFQIVETVDFPNEEYFDIQLEEGEEVEGDEMEEVEDENQPPPAPPSFPPPQEEQDIQDQHQEGDEGSHMEEEEEEEVPTVPKRVEINPSSIPSIYQPQPPPSSIEAHIPPQQPPPPQVPLLGPILDTSIKVVEEYTPRVAAGGASRQPDRAIDPITQRQIPLEDATKHMKVELLDPKWREQNQRFLEKQEESAHQADSMIASSLQAFAKQRGDIFGTLKEEERQLLQRSGEEDEAKKRRMLWDESLQQPGSKSNKKSDGGGGGDGSDLGKRRRGPEPSVAPFSSSSSNPLMMPDEDEEPDYKKQRTTDQVDDLASYPPPPPPSSSSSLSLDPNPLVDGEKEEEEEKKKGGGEIPIITMSDHTINPLSTHAPPPPPPPSSERIVVPEGAEMVKDFNGIPVISNLAGGTVETNIQHIDLSNTSMDEPVRIHQPVTGGSGSVQRIVKKQPSSGIFNGLVPEEEFISSRPLPITIEVQTLNVEKWEMLDGRSLSIQVNVSETIKSFKKILSDHEELKGLAANKIQLKHPSFGFLKDNMTLGKYNLDEGDGVELSVKTRGGRKKR